MAVANDHIASLRLQDAAARVRDALPALQQEHQPQAVAVAIKVLPHALREPALQATQHQAIAKFMHLRPAVPQAARPNRRQAFR